LDLGDFEILTFDCYGTLIDWETGLLSALQPLLSARSVRIDDEALLELYAELETQAEAGPYRPYRELLQGIVTEIGRRLGFSPSAAETRRLPESIASWPPFPDSPAALQTLRRRFKLAVLSNIDDDLFAGSARLLGTEFDEVITARQARSYKPSPRNFALALERLNAPKEKILHVAQSLYHDIAPANRIGLKTVWVNRRAGRAGAGATPAAVARPDMVVPDLATLARLSASE
jgi:2-haloacid dehalogenase